MDDNFHILDEIEEVAGRDAALALAGRYGGTTIYIPAEPRDGHPLVALLGKEVAAKIGAHFKVGRTGARLLIPKGQNWEAKARHSDIVSLIESGVSAREIASRLGVHERTVYRHRARKRNASKRLRA